MKKKNIQIIDKIISLEKKYFHPILYRQTQASNKEKKKWRNETIYERKKRISTEVYKMYDGIIQFGPFKGMKISDKNWWGNIDLAPMILGTYEKEIINFIFSKKCEKFTNFINIGAADGFYSCGLLFSRRMNNCLAFEQNIKGRKIIKINSELNSVNKKIQVYGKADSNILKKIENMNLKKTLLLIDIEGNEFNLLNQSFLNFFSNSLLIVEIHNWVDNFWSKYEKLLKLASNYFKIEFIKNQKRDLCNLKEFRDFTDDNRLLMISESRPCVMRFLVLIPKH